MYSCRACRWKKFTFLLASVLAGACRRNDAPRVGNPDDPAVVRAGEAVDYFHAGINEGRYQELCQTTETGAFAAVTSLPCSDFLAYLHQKLGTFIAARRSQLPAVEDRPSGAMVRVELSYETDYKNGAAHERFGWRINGSRVTLTSYEVEAEALSH